MSGQSGTQGYTIKLRTGTLDTLGNIYPGEIVCVVDASNTPVGLRLNASSNQFIVASNTQSIIQESGVIYPGSQGTQGATGQAGLIGMIGYDGSQGFLGYRGDTGIPGPPSMGLIGSTGQQGLQGTPGAQGVGQTGSSGIQGSQGALGIIGVGGAVGSIGSIGATGDTGIQGVTGGKGVQGSTGYWGPEGWTGAQGGSTGPTGAQGARGWTGAQGISGDSGVQGDTGPSPTGATGVQGVTGSTGASADTGASGIRGATGQRGAQGDTGNLGDTGPAGARGVTGAKGSQGSTGSQGYTGAQAQTTDGTTGAQGAQGATGAQGDMGVQGDTGVGSPGSTGVSGRSGDTGAQGATGSSRTGVTGITGSQGFRGSQGSTGAQGNIGDTGAQGSASIFSPPSLTGIGYIVGYTGIAGSPYVMYSSNLVYQSNRLTAATVQASNFSTGLLVQPPYTATTITYLASSNSGSNTLFIIKNNSNSYPVTASSQNLYANFPNNLFTQMVIHPSGWAYLYSDSNVTYPTACNYIFSFNMTTSNLSNLGFNVPINHMAIDPVGCVFVSYCNLITKYTVTKSTGALTSNYSWTVPPGSKLYVTAGYVYAYLSGTTSNILRFNNFSNTASNTYTSAIFSNESTLSFLSCDPKDFFIYSTTASGNVYSYSVVTSNVRRVASNLDIATNIPYVDPYTNTLYSSLSTLGSIQSIPLDGTPSSNLITIQPPVTGSFNQSIAGFASPTGLVYNPVDSNVYVCSSFLIRKITPLGQVSTLAGRIYGNTDGVGTDATFGNAYTVCVDTAGSTLYITDIANNSIRKLVLSTSNVSTFATGLSGPQGIVCDATNLYVADTRNHVIKSYVLANASMSFYAGSNGVAGSLNGTGSVARFNFPKGLAMNSNYSVMFVADSSNYTVRAIIPSTASTTTYMGQVGVRGFGACNFIEPTSVAMNSNGVLFVTDTGSNAILFSKSQAIISSTSTTFAGAVGIYTLSVSPSSPSIVYTGDVNTNKVQSYNLSTSTLTTLYTTVSAPRSVVVDSSLNTYVLVQGQGIYRNNTLVTGTNTIGINVSPMCIDQTATYIYAITTHNIYKLTLPSGPAVLLAGSPANTAGYADGIGSNARFNYPSALCIDNEGSNLYVSDTYNCLLRKVNLLTSNVTTVLGSNASPQQYISFVDGVGSTVRFTFTQGISMGNSGLLYLIDEVYNIFAPILRIVNLVTLSVITLGPPVAAQATANFYINPSENSVYFGQGNGFAINSLGYTTSVLAGSNLGYVDGTGVAARFNTPLGITCQGSNVIVTDRGNYILRAITPGSNVTTYAGSNTTARNVDGVTPFYVNVYVSMFSSITSYCVDNVGNIYVGDGQYIRLVNAAGAVSTIASNFSSPQGMAFDPFFTRLYISDTGNNMIKCLTLSNYAVTLIAGSTQGNSEATSSVLSVVTPPLPTTLPGLQLWLDATDPYGNGTTPVNYTSIATWADKSGKGYNAVATGGSPNSFYTPTLNGLPGIQLSGNTYNTGSAKCCFSSTVPASTFQGGISMFIVYQAGSGNNASYCTPVSRVGAGGNIGSPNIRGANLMVLNNPPTGDFIQYTNPLNPVGQTSPHVYNVSLNPSQSPYIATFSNGVSFPPTVQGAYGPSAGAYNVSTFDSLSTNIYVGWDGYLGYLNGTVYEVIVYNTNLSVTQRQIVEGYLAYKWGLSLEPSHPYYGRSSAVSTYTIAPIPAQFNSPSAICMDRINTNIYVADYGNSVIRLINLSTATTSIFYSSGLVLPRGMCIDVTSTNLYVADFAANVIVRIVISTKSGQTFAGSTNGFVNGIGVAAQFSSPTYLITDSAGSNLYVADLGNNAIRQIVLSNASVRTLAGSGTAGSSNGVGVAATFNQPNTLGIFSNIVYTGEVGNLQIRAINLVTSNVTRWAGSNAAGYLDSTLYYVNYTTPQTLTLYSNALYVTMSSVVNSAMVRIPFSSYPTTTFTFSNPVNLQVQNSTGRPLTLTVTGGTLTNSNLNSLPNITDVMSLYNTSGSNYTLI